MLDVTIFLQPTHGNSLTPGLGPPAGPPDDAVAVAPVEGGPEETPGSSCGPTLPVTGRLVTAGCSLSVDGLWPGSVTV